MSITLTPGAVAEMRRVMREQGLDPAVTQLVVRYNPRGWPEQCFEMQLRESRESAGGDDATLESGGIQICCDAKSYRFAKGITIDVKETNGQRSFAITQPKSRWPLAKPFAARWLEEALRQVVDPEVGLNIVDLGLIYETKIDANQVVVIMTMTTPACPMTDMILTDVKSAVLAAGPNIAEVQIELVWEPPWTRDMISQRGREEMGWK